MEGIIWEILYKNKVLKSKLFPNYAKRFRSLFVTLQPNLKNPIWT
jgi:hypothetical protein